MLSKLITYGKTREEAIELMIDAIDNYKIVGAKTTLPFGKFVCNHEAFRYGNFDTHFVKNYYSAAKLQKEIEAEAKIAASVALKLYLDEQKLLKTPLT
jgi:propionyl-CoA carboxylase alpha chain